MAKPTIRIGIMPQEKIREMTIKIARGEFKPGRNTPKIWFPSMKSLSEVLSDHNRELLRVIARERPESIAALARMTNREPGNVSRTINTMKKYGLVKVEEINRRKQPIAEAAEFLIQAT